MPFSYGMKWAAESTAAAFSASARLVSLRMQGLLVAAPGLFFLDYTDPLSIQKKAAKCLWLAAPVWASPSLAGVWPDEPSLRAGRGGA